MKNVILFLFLLLLTTVFSQTREDYQEIIKQNENEAIQLVDMQLNAYNARNINMFLEPYSDSVAVYTFPRELNYVGKEKMREIYADMFEKITDLHCEITNRIVCGSTLIDSEYVTGNNGMEFNAVAIYSIRDGKIAEVHFVVPQL